MQNFGVVLLALVAINVQANDCLNAGNLRKLDNQYEEALRVGDTAFLQGLLADEFVWVHNLAVEAETKPVLLARLANPSAETKATDTKARLTSDVSVHSLDNTAVLSGLSSVDKAGPDSKAVRTSRYQFMRTYVASGNRCRLLSVQTMKVWSSLDVNKELD